MLFGQEEKLDGKKLSQNRHNTSSSKHFFPHTSNDFHSRINYSEPINQKELLPLVPKMKIKLQKIFQIIDTFSQNNI